MSITSAFIFDIVVVWMRETDGETKQRLRREERKACVGRGH